LTERATSFVETWVSENISAEKGFQLEGDVTLARGYAEQCLAAAKASGIPESEIDDEFEDLSSFMAFGIEEANNREMNRQIDNQS
jgi:hypothetical protein